MRFPGVLAVSLGLLVLCAFLSETRTRALTHQRLVVLVTAVERVCEPLQEGGEACRNLVYTDQGTFRNGPHLWSGKFRIDPMQEQLAGGGHFVVETVGFEKDRLGREPNIISAEPASL